MRHAIRFLLNFTRRARLPRLSLRTKVIFTICIVQAVWIAAFMYVVLYNQHEMAEESSRQIHQSFAVSLAVACADAISKGDKAALRHHVVKASERDNINYVIVEDAEGVLLESAIHGPNSRFSVDEILELSSPSQGSNKIVIQEIGEPPRGFLDRSGHNYDVDVPIFDAEGIKRGAVRVGFSTEAMNEKVIQVAYKAIEVALLAVIVAGAIIAFVDWQMKNILRNLIRVTTEMAGGDLNQRVEINTGDELQTLGESFNKMAESLHERERERGKLEHQLKEYAEQLEQKVEERTKELRDSQAQLLQSGKLAAVGELAAGVAHQINNPIGVILMKARLLSDKAEKMRLPEKMRVDLGKVAEHAERIGKVTKGLLTFSRQSPGERKRIGLNDILADALLLVEHRLSVENIALEKDLQSDLPPIVADPIALQQVFLNVINNSIDAMPEGGRLTIRTRLSEFSNDLNRHASRAGRPQAPRTSSSVAAPHRAVRVVIEDTGVGIHPDVMDKVFDPFFTTKEMDKGTGLGLSISYGIVKEHGGRIDVESDPGGGARFVITIPIDERAEQ